MDIEVQNIINGLNEKADMATPAQQENNIESICAVNHEASFPSNCTDEFPLCNKVTNIKTITTTSTSLDELKNFRISRKRELEGSKMQQVDEKPFISIPTLPLLVPPPPPLLQPPPAKQFCYKNQIAERKSIIEIHIANVEVKKPPSNEMDKLSDLKLDDNEIIENSKQLLENIKEENKTEECINESEFHNVGDENALENGTAAKVTLNEEDKHLEDSKTQDIVEISKDNVEVPTTPVEVAVDESIMIEDQQKLQEKAKEEVEYLLSLEKLTPEEALKDQEYRKECKVFLQHLPCFKLESNDDNTATLLPNTIIPVKIPKCRECRRRTPQQGSNDVYCRFYEFRCFQYTNEGHLLIAGFPNPYMDATREDLNIWQPDENTEPTSGYMDIQVCRYILLHVGDQFCHLWRQEVEALKLHENPNSTIAWKKVVQGIREICDVCDTTLFNYHWTCDKCGFGVCLDCFKDCKGQVPRRKTFASNKPKKGCDEYGWLLCTFGSSHNIKELILTQIIAGDALNVLGRLLHGIRVLWEIPQLCGCLLSKQKLPDGDLKNFIQDMIKESQLKQQTTASSLATEETKRKQERLDKIHAKTLEFARSRGIDYVPGRIWNKQTLGKDPITTAFDNCKHINFLRKGLTGYRRFLPPRAMTLTHSTLLAPGVPHEWHDGKLLRLMNPSHPDNRILFQEVWKCGQPVMISEVAKSLNLDLWRPEAFLRDFGDKPNDLINCLNGNLVPNQPMRHFWEGFQCMNKRLLDANGKPMLLKLKDWPPGDDFAEILPTRYQDLMRGLPMPEYTLRTGNLNIASCLPKMFVPPDLGPKMYNAYGSAFHPDKGTTNLHLDISDAVNIMVYVGIPDDIDSKAQVAAAHKAIAMGGCEFLMRARVLKKDVFPGALWHIFPARDADKIRDLLNRITLEKGYRLEPDHDPIHDQNWYLDDKLRARLFKEYGVEGYPIVQCLGDAVFIPAGAPHQVQNLHNCIKVAEDFVSPENITHCFHLTQEFRLLSHSHTNHEDKLQIKNIVYHAIKDCCTILKRALEKRIDQETTLIEAELEKSRLLKLNATAMEEQSGSSTQVSGIPSDEVDSKVKSTENSSTPSAESETILNSLAKLSTSVDETSEELSINNILPTVSGDQIATSDEKVSEIPKVEEENLTIITTDTERTSDSKIAVVLSSPDNDESISINGITETVLVNTENTNDTNLSAKENSISISEVSGGVLNCDIPNISSLSAKNESIPSTVITELELKSDKLSNDSNLSSNENSTSVRENLETESIDVTFETAAE